MCSVPGALGDGQCVPSPSSHRPARARDRAVVRWRSRSDDRTTRVVVGPERQQVGAPSRHGVPVVASSLHTTVGERPSSGAILERRGLDVRIVDLIGAGERGPAIAACGEQAQPRWMMAHARVVPAHVVALPCFGRRAHRRSGQPSADHARLAKSFTWGSIPPMRSADSIARWSDDDLTDLQIVGITEPYVTFSLGGLLHHRAPNEAFQSHMC
jgi:hypothetical protein